MMRTECRHYETRTYPTGDAVRKCDLDLAPEAPWRCPADCALYERRSDVGWTWSVIAPPTPAEPVAEGIAELLEAAEEIVNAAGPSIVAELQASQSRGGRFRRLFKRKPR